MSVELTKEDEDVINQLIEQGQFQSPAEAIHEALKRLRHEAEIFPFKGGPVYPPGSLLHLYTDEENEKELRLVRSHAKKLEGF
jgi:hypothetical protein